MTDRNVNLVRRWLRPKDGGQFSYSISTDADANQCGEILMRDPEGPLGVNVVTRGEAFAIADMLTEGKLSALLEAIEDARRSELLLAGDPDAKWVAVVQAREAFK